MAEVTREMILEYMRSKSGVVKNVDLVRHFRKYLQLSDHRAKDQARDHFKSRVNEVAYIKADSKGEKYLYLKAEFTADQSTAGDSSTHISVSKRDSAHSLLSKRDSAFSILSETSGQEHSRSSGQRASTTRSPQRDSPGHGAGLSTPSGQQSGQSSRPTSTAAAAPRDTAPLSLLGDSLLSDSTLSSFLGGSSALGSTSGAAKPSTTPTATPTTTSGGVGDSSFASDIFGAIGGSFWGDSGALSGGGTISSDSRSKSAAKPSTAAPPPPPSRSTSRQTSSSSKAASSQIPGGGSLDITLQSYKPLSSPPRVPSLPPPSRSNPAPPPSRSPPAPPTSRSSLAPPPSRSPPAPPTSRSNPAPPPSRSPPAPPTSRSTPAQPPSRSPPAPPTSRSTPAQPPSRSPPSPPTSRSNPVQPPSRSPPAPPPSRSPPAPPQRNLNYTLTGSSSSSSSSSAAPLTSGSVFSPPPPSATGGGSSLLSELTSDLGSFGELGSLLDSFGDFSLDKKPTSSSTQPSSSTSQSMATLGGRDQATPLTSSSGSDRSSNVTLVAEGKPPPAPSHSSPPHSSPPHSSPPHSSQPHCRGNPAKSSATGGGVAAVRSTPPPAPGSPMRVPRSQRNGGSLVEAPPSPLSRRHGSLDGPQWQASQDGSPRIQIHRVDSSHSDALTNGMPSPPHHTAAAMGGGGDMRGRALSSGLPPLPPSAMLGPTSDPRKMSGAATTNGVILRPGDRAARERAMQSGVRRSRNMDKTTNLDTLTRASIMMTPPSVRRSFHQAPGAGGSGMYARPAPSSSGEDLSQGQEDGSLSAPSDEYELDPLEKEWMLACASADLESLLSIIMKDDTLINRKDFLHGTALHWAAKLGRCDIMSALILNGAFPNIKSGGFTPLHLACQGGYDNAIAMLVRDHRANVNVRDNSGRKPVDMLNYNCHENSRVLLTGRESGRRTVHHSSEYLPSFSQPRNRVGNLTNTWASMPNSLESSDEKKKRSSPKMNKRTFSFRNKHKINSPGHDKKERPRSHIPETYDA